MQRIIKGFRQFCWDTYCVFTDRCHSCGGRVVPWGSNKSYCEDCHKMY